LIGSADSVPTIAALLTDKELSHMARYALERMPCPEAVKAMRDALSQTEGLVKVGVINSLGVRRDAESVGTMIKLLDDSDPEIVAAAAAALGSIGNTEAAKALGAFQAKAPEPLQLPAADAYLTCAERLLADGNKAEAMVIYKALSKAEQKHVRLAAVRGMLAVTGQK
jgi:HEAT repeat protein